MTGQPSKAPPTSPLAARSRALRRRRREGLVLVPVELSKWRHLPAFRALGLLPKGEATPTKPELAKAVQSFLNAAQGLADIAEAMYEREGDGAD